MSNLIRFPITMFKTSKRKITSQKIEDIENELQNASIYCKNNFLKLNAAKSVRLDIFNRKTEFNHKLSIDNIEIPSKQNHKHLGIVFDTKLNFNENIDFISKKVTQKWCYISRICKHSNLEILIRMFKSNIRPLIETNIIAYPINLTQMKRLENIQKACLRRIHFRSNSNINFQQFLKANKIDSVEIRRKNQILLHLQKTKLNFENIPRNWKKHLKFFQHLPTGRDGWKANCNIKFDHKIFYCYAAKMFNELDLKTRNNFTINQYRSMLKT